MADTIGLQEALKRLQYADPAAFNDFLREIQKWEVEACRATVSSSATDILRIQGFAQAAGEFLRIIQDAVTRRK